MPELPEVETIRSDLAKKIVGRKITDFLLLSPKTLKNIDEADFKKLIIGSQIRKVKRRAKIIILDLNNDNNLIFHMKMTGHLLLEPSRFKVKKDGTWSIKEKELKDPFNQYIRAIFWLDNDIIMAFSDLRKFGYIKLIKDELIEDLLGDYGPEPFSKGFNHKYLKDLSSKRKISIKKLLMDQSLIAGIGNIYADEILFASKIHPEKAANKITDKEIGLIIENTKIILTKAIKMRGTSSSDYRDTSGKKGNYEKELLVYRRSNQPCRICQSKIERIVVGGRGTHFCPNCQKEKSNKND